MNVLQGKITSIKTNGSLSLVTVGIDDIYFNTIIIETPDTASYLKQGNHIKMIFKETEVIVGKGVEHSLSIQNKAIGEIINIKKGKLLSTVIIDSTVGHLTAIITSDAADQMQLEIGEKITAMIKTTEIMLSE
ncbi:molybdate transport system regulatory protein [Aquimarina sp. MAR_2010_214]|uniref:TOBE domain-containing protein n=1 Tax=Aquimarina sp. MAR_2010_214 TaxID=1250026 RepID=UPI000C70E177|nr:TOBE domain-containing protein [Aquimarina sp. MAR_2010_214]PKV49065.1 molybdate transport system regulatory protein [Aquimarina sp. MAR_2010_214]